jgi:hypothetical protein
MQLSKNSEIMACMNVLVGKMSFWKRSIKTSEKKKTMRVLKTSELEKLHLNKG